MRIIFIFILALVAGVGTLFADGTTIGDLNYNLNADNQTAEVTYQKQWNNANYSTLQAAIIPETVEYNSVTYTVTSIGDYAFGFSPSLKSVTIPNTVTSLGMAVFGYCTALTSIIIPGSVTSIGVEISGGCSVLTSIVVEKGNRIYDSRDNCNAIIETATNKLVAGCQNTTIPNEVTSIEDYAFEGCVGLTAIVIPEGVTDIGKSAFSGCTGLKSIICKALTPPACGNNYAFRNVPESIPLYVPANSLDAYKEAEIWKDFTNRQVIPDNPISDLEPVETEPNKETAITFTVGGPSSSAVLLNLQATDSYNESKQCVELHTILDDANVAQLMDNILKGICDFGSVFSGVSFFLPAGSGEMKLDICTYGMQLSVHIGNSGVAHLTRDERGEAVVQYDITEPTLVCIHASIQAAGSPARHILKQTNDEEKRVELYGIKILPDGGVTGIGEVQITDGQLPVRIVKDSHVLILRDGKVYTLQGQEMK